MAAALPAPDAEPQSGAGGGGSRGRAGAGNVTGGDGAGGTGSSGGSGTDAEPPGRGLVQLIARIRSVLLREHNVFLYTSRAHARAAAESRRAAVAHLLEPTSSVRLEIPPGAPDAVREVLVSQEPDLIAQDVSLRWQLKSEPLLLLGRATDAVRVAIAEVAIREDRPIAETMARTAPSVAVTKLPVSIALVGRKLFPWRVIVGSRDTALMRRALPQISRWLGIGIDLVDSEPAVRLGGCQNGNGSMGTVEGTLIGPADEYLLTCAHVLADKCCAVHWRSNLARQSPDAALLVQAPECFPFDSANAWTVPTATTAQCQDALEAREQVIRRDNAEANRTGIIDEFVSMFSLEGAAIAFPTLRVRRRTFRYGLIPWPLVRRTFSRPGDSGSWVFNAAGTRWFGIVVGAKGSDSYVHIAEQLVEYFNERLRATPFGDPRLEQAGRTGYVR